MTSLPESVNRPEGAERVLRDTGELRSWVGLPGAPEDEWVPAVARFKDGQLEVELWTATSDWPTTFQRGSGDLTVHGLTVEGQKPFTILRTRVTKLAMAVPGPQARRLRGGTLVLGAHVDEDTTWSCLRLQTARLHEWLGRQDVERDQTLGEESFTLLDETLRWSKHDPLRIQRDEAEILISPSMEPAGDDGPDFTIRTQTDFVVRPITPLTLTEFNRQYIVPVLALMTLASSGPDGVMLERVSDRSRKEAATILHSGSFRVDPRAWDPYRPGARFLFTAADVPDAAELLDRWFDLWPGARDAILTFADTFRDDGYSRSRVLALAVALEAYWRTRFFEASDDEHKTKLIDKYKRVYKHTGVAAKTLATNDKQLQILVAARHLYAHLDQRNKRLDEAQIDDAIVDNARRAAVLFQAALLRDLEIGPRTIKTWIERHTKNWPLG